MSDAEVIVRQDLSIVEIGDRDVAVVDREVVSIVSEGIQGPPGASGAGFVFTQGSPTAEWVVNHNLGFKPAVMVFDAGGSEVEAEVLHTSVNQARIYFSVPLAGFARCV
jgi:hypothetical protein